MNLILRTCVLAVAGALAPTVLAEPGAMRAGTLPAPPETRAAWLQLEREAAQLTARERRFDQCPPGEPDRRRLLLTEDGTPRAYVDRYGSGDALVGRSHVYDAAGRLVAARIEARAASGAQRVYQLQLDPSSGRVVWQGQRLAAGPGWTFPDFWSPADLVRDPRTALAAPSACARELPR